MECDPMRMLSPLIYLKINGAKPLAFMLDTGCGYRLMVTKATQQQLHLKELGSSTSYGVKYGWTAVDTATLSTSDTAEDIKLNPDINSPIRVPVLPDALEKGFLNRGIAGLVGMPLLKACSPCRLDFVHQVLILNVHEDLKLTMHDAVELKLIDKNSGVMDVEVMLNSTLPVELMLDTGSPETELPQMIADKMKLDYFGTMTYHDIFGEYLNRFAVLEKVDLGKYVEPNVKVGITSLVSRPGEDREWQLLGMNLLARFRITLDLVQNKMYLERSEDYAQRARNRGRTLVTLLAKQDKIFVDDVPSWSAASQSGLQSGDEVVSVDGIAVDKKPLITVQWLIDGYEKTPATLALRRREKLINIDYQREPFVSLDAENKPLSETEVFMEWGGTIYPPANINHGKPISVPEGSTVIVPHGATVKQNPAPTKKQ